MSSSKNEGCMSTWLQRQVQPLNPGPTGVRAEFHGERIVDMHMQRLGGKEQLLAQVYSAFATRRDDTVELALRAYGAPTRHPARPSPGSPAGADRGVRRLTS